MTRKFSVVIAGLVLLCGAMLQTQGRSAPDWTTQGGDAQRSGSIPVDPWLSLASLPEFKFLWKITVENDTRQMNALTSPVSMANLNTFRGFKSLVFVGGSANNVFAIDYDFGTVFWKTHFNYSSGVPEYAGSPACPGGMTSGVTRPTNLNPPGQLAFMGFARAPRAAKAEVGEPGKGAPQLPAAASAAGGTAGRGATPAPASAANSGGGRAAAPAAPAAPPAVGRGAPNAVFAVGSDGILRSLNPINGDAMIPPTKLLPPNASGFGLIQADGMVYAVTSNGCGSTADGVWAMDVSRDERPVVSWNSNGAPVSGPAFGPDGTLYVATGDGTSAYANSIVALDGKTLRLKEWFTVAGGRFATSPMVFTEETRSYVAAAGGDGRLYLLAADVLGGPDHKTPLASTSLSSLSGAHAPLSVLGTWRDASGMRRVVAATQGSGDAGTITAFRVNVGAGAPPLAREWVSREMISPRAPIIVNGVVFALSGGNRTSPAVLYALNPETGKEIWNSGSTITSFTSGVAAGLSAGTGQVYVVTYDNTLWAFGIPQAY